MKKRKTWYVRFETKPDNPDQFTFTGSKTACMKYLKERGLRRAFKNGFDFGGFGIPRMGYFI